MLGEKLAELAVRLGKGIEIDGVKRLALFKELWEDILPFACVNDNSGCFIPFLCPHICQYVWMSLNDMMARRLILMALNIHIDDAHAKSNVQHSQTGLVQDRIGRF